jgi:hypothetical protein
MRLRVAPASAGVTPRKGALPIASNAGDPTRGFPSGLKVKGWAEKR